MMKLFLPKMLVVTVLSLATSQAGAQDWPQFLGPKGNAKSTDKVPTEWNAEKNLLWKLELPGAGSSSPIVIGQRVFVTCYQQDGGSITRTVVCVDKKTGKKLWEKKFPSDYREDAYRGYIQEHGYASNTPVSDGKQLFVFFGKGGVHALSLEGKLNWSVDVGKRSSNRQWGSASSLVLHKDLLIVNAAEEDRAIIALNKSDGKVVWQQKANMLELTYGTPRLVSLKNGNEELVINVPGELWALNPNDGKLNWFVETPMTGNVSPSVIVDSQTVYGFGGYRSSGSMSVTAGGTDDMTKSGVNWTGRASSYVATPLLHDGKFFWIDDRGLAWAIDAADGKQIYRQRVKGLSGRPVYASPVLIGGNIYVVTRQAGTIVYSPGDKYQEIARNEFTDDDSDFNASPAVSESRLFLRSNKALYCIGEAQ